MPKSKKKPKIATQPQTNRQPTFAKNPDSYMKEKPTWSFCRCDNGHELWSLCKCENLWDKVIKKLGDLETQTWAEIVQTTGHGDHGNNHFVSINDLSKNAQTRLAELHLDQIDTVFSISLEGKMRLYGLVEGTVYKLLWWDPDHGVCLSAKKHT